MMQERFVTIWILLDLNNENNTYVSGHHEEKGSYPSGTSQKKRDFSVGDQSHLLAVGEAYQSGISCQDL